MPTIAWPAFLPCPQLESHGYTPRSAALTSDFGLIPRAREIYSDAPADFAVTWSLTADQLWYFEGFHKHALRNGTLDFTLPIYAAGTVEEREVTFAGKPWSVLLQGYRDGRLTASLITRKGTAMDAGTWDALQEYGTPDELAAIYEAFNHFVEVEIPIPTYAED